MTEEPPSIRESADLADPSSAPPSSADFGALAGRITVDVNIPEGRWLDHLSWLETLAGEAARDACLAGGGSVLSDDVMAEISLTFADDNFIRQLNAQHRGIDEPTNVLSFPAALPADAEPPHGGESNGAGLRPELLLGDVVLGLETILREAESQGKRLGDHVAHLVAHGVLHLLGFDHRQDEEAAHMERLETMIMENLGIGDPYRTSNTSGSPVEGNIPPEKGSAR